jgi:hypothetical protein
MASSAHAHVKRIPPSKGVHAHEIDDIWQRPMPLGHVVWHLRRFSCRTEAVGEGRKAHSQHGEEFPFPAPVQGVMGVI